MKFNNQLKDYKKYVLTPIDRTNIVNNSYDIQTTLPSLSINDRINLCDSVIEHALSVFGPYGGLYGELCKFDQYDVFTKGKDGHNFLETLRYTRSYEQAFLTAIKAQTGYITGYKDNTSRDGSTSLAMIACGITKMQLISKLCNPAYKEVPSTVINTMFSVLQDVATNFIEEHKVKTFDSNTLTFLKNGKERVLNAIKTTTDNNDLFIEPFKDICDQIETEKLSFDNAQIYDIKREVGKPKIKLNVTKGFRMTAGEISPNCMLPFKSRKTNVFFLDGYIDPMHIDIFKVHFETFMIKLLKTKDKNGQLLYSKSNTTESRLDYPIIMVNRVKEGFAELYEKYQLDGFQIQLNDGTVEKMTPTILMVQTTMGDAPLFEEVKKIIPDMFINMNSIHHYICKNKPEDKKPNDSLMVKDVKGVERFYPNISTVGTTDQFTLNTMKTTKVEVSQGEFEYIFENEKEETRTFSNTLCSVGFNGSMISILPHNEASLLKIEEIITECKNKKESIDNQLTADDEHIKFIIDRLNAIALTPVVYAPSNDEYMSLRSVLEDAIGIFQSTLKEGIMPGGNIFFIKYFNKFRKLAKNKLELTITTKKYSESKYHEYHRYFDILLDNIEAGYQYIYSLLLNDDKIFEYIMKDVNNNDSYFSKNKLLSYNIVTGKYTVNILEASRSTLDTMCSSLLILKDNLLMQRISIKDPIREFVEITSGHHERRYNSKMLSKDEILVVQEEPKAIEIKTPIVQEVPKTVITESVKLAQPKPKDETSAILPPPVIKKPVKPINDYTSTIRIAGSTKEESRISIVDNSLEERMFRKKETLSFK